MICICGLPCHETPSGDQWKVGTNGLGTDVLLQVQDRDGEQVRIALNPGEADLLGHEVQRASGGIQRSTNRPANPPLPVPLKDGPCACSKPPDQNINYAFSPPRCADCGGVAPGYKLPPAPGLFIDFEARQVIDGWVERLVALREQVERIDAQAGHALAKAEGLEEWADAINGRICSLEADKAAHAVITTVQKAEGMVAGRLGPRETCRKGGAQECHCCESLVCINNASPGAELYRAAKALVGVPWAMAGSRVADVCGAVKKVEEMG